MKFPEPSRLEQPHLVEGEMLEAKKKFYELAAKQTRHLSGKESLAWMTEHLDSEGVFRETDAILVMRSGEDGAEEADRAKRVSHLEIIVNDDAFKTESGDFSDVIPFVLEHQVYEAWLEVKKGAGDTKYNPHQKHMLARRREYLMAEEQGKGGRLLAYHTVRDAGRRDECEAALAYAKQRIRSKLK